MIVSRNQEYLDQARYLSITAKDDALFFVHNEVGYNYRMLNLQAALGVSQIDELEMFIEIKKRNYLKYKELLSDSNGLELLPFTENTRANHWFYSLYVDQDKFGCSRDELMHRLIAASIQCRPVWKLNHKQMPYQANQAYLIVNALDYEAKILNLPCSTNLKLEEVEYISSKIKEKNV
jgi:perosamine synthetase